MKVSFNHSVANNIAKNSPVSFKSTVLYDNSSNTDYAKEKSGFTEENQDQFASELERLNQNRDKNVVYITAGQNGLLKLKVISTEPFGDQTRKVGLSSVENCGIQEAYKNATENMVMLGDKYSGNKFDINC